MSAASGDTIAYEHLIHSIFYGRHASGHVLSHYPELPPGRHRRAEWDLDVDESAN